MENELKKIILKVRELFKKYGIKSMTMDDIAHELRISKKTLYKYVQNKEELVDKVVEHAQNEKGKYFMELSESGLNAIQILIKVNKIAQKMLEEYNSSLEYDLNKYHPEIYKKAKKRTHENMFNSVLANLKQGQNENLYRKEVNAELISKLYVLRIDSLMDNMIITREQLHNADTINQLLEYHIRGIANEKGIAEYEKYKDN